MVISAHTNSNRTDWRHSQPSTSPTIKDLRKRLAVNQDDNENMPETDWQQAENKMRTAAQQAADAFKALPSDQQRKGYEELPTKEEKDNLQETSNDINALNRIEPKDNDQIHKFNFIDISRRLNNLPTDGFFAKGVRHKKAQWKKERIKFLFKAVTAIHEIYANIVSMKKIEPDDFIKRMELKVKLTQAIGNCHKSLEQDDINIEKESSEIIKIYDKYKVERVICLKIKHDADRDRVPLLPWGRWNIDAYKNSYERIATRPAKKDNERFAPPSPSTPS